MMLFFYYLLYRYYDRWLNTLLLCHRNESFILRAYKLFNAYWPICLLMTFILSFVQFGFTLTFDFHWYSVFFYSSSALLFLVRAIQTTPLLDRIQHSEQIIIEVINASFIISIIGTFNILHTYIFNRPSFDNAIMTFFGTILISNNFTIQDFLTGACIFIFPILFVSSIAELILFGYCRWVCHSERNWSN